MNILSSIDLSEEDSLLFVEFQKRYAFIQALDSIHAFDIKNGSLTIHFDSLGQVRSMDKQEHFRV